MKKLLNTLLVLCLIFVSFENSIAQSTIVLETTVALADAVRANDLETVKRNFTDNAVMGIDPNSNLHPLHLAAKLGNYEIVEFFVIKEKSMETGIYVTRGTKPAMIHAIENGHLSVVKVLVEKGSRQAKGSWNGKPYIQFARENNQSSIIQYLTAKGARKSDILFTIRFEDISSLDSYASKLTQELNSHLTLSGKQQKEVEKLHLVIANLTNDVRNKYGDDEMRLFQEENEIFLYRQTRLQRILSEEQFAQVK